MEANRQAQRNMSRTARRSRPQSRLPGILLLTCALGAAGIWAAEAPAGKSTEQSAAEPPAQPAASAEADAPAPAPSAEVFIPTEEISEDFAVAFPVDI